jgi:hypothetical protein
MQDISGRLGQVLESNEIGFGCGTKKSYRSAEHRQIWYDYRQSLWKLRL